MGYHPNISHKRFPSQGGLLGKSVDVCFEYDTKNYVTGVVVRDDLEEPGVTIIKLADGRYVLDIECQIKPT